MTVYSATQLALLDRVRAVLLDRPDRRSLPDVARLVASFTTARVAAIAVEDKASGRLRLFYGHRAPEIGARLLEEQMPAGEGVIGWALRHGKTFVSPNVRFDVKYSGVKRLAETAGYVSVAAVPIVSAEEVLGVLAAGYGQERDFSRQELALLEKVAGQLNILLGGAQPQETLHHVACEAARALSESLTQAEKSVANPVFMLPEQAAMVARRMRLGESAVEAVRLGSALLDIGEIIVPEQILRKPARLTDQEFEVVKQHSQWGAMICKRASIFAPAYPVVYHHHERFDGSGYPDRLAGSRIPLAARIVTVVDAYHAMISKRPYRRAATPAEALYCLRQGAGRQWDPNVVQAFSSVLASLNGGGFQVRHVPVTGN